MIDKKWNGKSGCKYLMIDSGAKMKKSTMEECNVVSEAADYRRAALYLNPIYRY